MTLPHDIQRALDVLNDAICSYERDTYREYTLLLVPHSPHDEAIAVSINGKPVLGQDPRFLLDDALTARES